MEKSSGWLPLAFFIAICNNRADSSLSNLPTVRTDSSPSAYTVSTHSSPSVPAVPTYSLPSVPSAPNAASNIYDYSPYDSWSLGAVPTALGVTMTGVVPIVLLINRAVILLYNWRERRRRRRNRARTTGRKRAELDEATFGGKAELSANQTRLELEARERRFEMDGADAKFELPGHCFRAGGRAVIGMHELRGDEEARELEV